MKSKLNTLVKVAARLLYDIVGAALIYFGITAICGVLSSHHSTFAFSTEKQLQFVTGAIMIGFGIIEFFMPLRVLFWSNISGPAAMFLNLNRSKKLRRKHRRGLGRFKSDAQQRNKKKSIADIYINRGY